MSEELTMADVKRIADEFDGGCFGPSVKKFLERKCGDGVGPEDVLARAWFESLTAQEVVNLADELFGNCTGIHRAVRKAAKIEERHCPECDTDYEDSDAVAAREAFPWNAAVEIAKSMLDRCPPFVGGTDVEVKDDLDPTVLHVKPSSRTGGANFGSLQVQLADSKDPILAALGQLDSTDSDLGTVDERLARIVVAAQRLLATKV